MDIGVVGFSDQKFDEEVAKEKISKAFDMLEIVFATKQFVIISGLTNLGIPKLAYEEAVKRDWKTVGIACSQANDYELFPVDETKIVGDEWGDESETFLNSIEVLLRFGGGDQSLEEVKQAKEMDIAVYEYSIPQ